MPQYTIVILSRRVRTSMSDFAQTTNERIGPFYNRDEAERALTAAVSHGAMHAIIETQEVDE
jgi:hypothetical protein